MFHIKACGTTHVGRRKNNQDAYCIEAPLGLFAVADGMGGYQGGEIASSLALRTLTEFFERNAEDNEATWPFAFDKSLSLAENMVDVAVRMANAAISARRKGPLAKMGTTLAMMLLPPHFVAEPKAPPQIVIGHLGDSRVYRRRDGLMSQITLDHSLYEQLKATGASVPPLEDFPHGNVITKALGIEPRMRPDLSLERIHPGDRYLLCTDGLTGPLPDHVIEPYMAMADPQAVSNGLVKAAYEAGGKDNITAVIVDIALARSPTKPSCKSREYLGMDSNAHQ